MLVTDVLELHSFPILSVRFLSIVVLMIVVSVLNIVAEA